MVRVEFRKADGLFCGFHAAGHAECGEPGEDIVCAAISAVTQMTAEGIRKAANVPTGVSRSDGDLYCTVDRDADRRQCEDADLLMQSMEQALRDIEKQYPKALKINIREV